MNIIKSIILPLFAIAALSLSACKTGNLTVDDVLKKHYAAIGQEKLEKVQAVSMSASMPIMGSLMRMNVFFKRPKKVRTEIHMMDMTVLMVMDGQKGYMAAPNQDVKEMTPEEIEKSLPQNIAMDDQLFQAQSQKAKFTLLGKEKLDSTEVYKLSLDYKGTNTGIDSATAYVDAKTFYLIRMITSQKVNNANSVATVKFSDFKTVDGITMPYLINISTPATKDIPMRFEKLDYNAQLDDSLFAKPSPIVANVPPQP